MAAPQNTTWANGTGAVSGDNLNTFVQWTDSYATLRTFIGQTDMTVYLIGGTTAGDGQQGHFYWNPTSLGPDDGVNTIVPNGATKGAWIREANSTVPVTFITSGTTVAADGNVYIALGNCTLQLPRSSLQTKAFSVVAFAYGGTITVTLAYASDVINGGSAGVGTSIPIGQRSNFNTDAAGIYYMTNVPSLMAVPSLVSAATTDIGSVGGEYVQVSGSATITSFGTTMIPGQAKEVRFTGSPSLINSSGLNLPASANISVTAGSLALVFCRASGVYDVFYQSNSASSSPTGPAQGRLSLVSGTPVMTSDLAGATVVYYNAYLGQYFPYYDGNTTTMVSFGSVVSLALDSNSGHTGYQQSGKNFDLFLTLNGSGTVILGTGPAWTSDTARSAALVYKNGFLTNQSVMTLKFDATSSTQSVAANQATYIGTMRASADGQTSWVANPAAAAGGGNCLLLIWNMYNRVETEAVSKDSTDSWTYTIVTWRSANNNTNNRVSFVRGQNEDFLSARYTAIGNYTNGAGGRYQFSGVGIDSTTAYSGTSGVSSTPAGGPQTITANYVGLPGIGFHYAQALEQAGSATDTANWYGDNGAPTNYQMSLAIQMRM